jgi:hypothetical protein
MLMIVWLPVIKLHPFNKLKVLYNMNSTCLMKVKYIVYTRGNAIIRNWQVGWTILYQQKYLKFKLQKFNMLNYNPYNTPMQSGVRWSKEDYPNPNTLRDTISPYHYSRIVGNLMHATINFRLDYTYVVNSLTQYLTNPSPSHIQTLKRVFWYIKGTLTLGITY